MILTSTVLIGLMSFAMKAAIILLISLALSTVHLFEGVEKKCFTDGTSFAQLVLHNPWIFSKWLAMLLVPP